MGKKRQYVPLAPWEARTENEKGYTRVTASLLYSDAVMGLNHAAFHVYMYMKQQSLGKPEFEFPHARFCKFISNTGFQTAVKELVRAGLIEVVENNKHRQKANVYRLSKKWRDFQRINGTLVNVSDAETPMRPRNAPVTRNEQKRGDDDDGIPSRKERNA